MLIYNRKERKKKRKKEGGGGGVGQTDTQTKDREGVFLHKPQTGTRYLWQFE